MYTYMMSRACVYPLSSKLNLFDTHCLCCIDGETEDFYIGNWVTGFGFVNVRFPKQYTRKLYWYEKYRYSNCYIAMGNSYMYRLNIKCNYYPDIIQMLEDFSNN